jgi:hypothetical protein
MVLESVVRGSSVRAAVKIGSKHEAEDIPLLEAVARERLV